MPKIAMAFGDGFGFIWLWLRRLMGLGGLVMKVSWGFVADHGVLGLDNLMSSEDIWKEGTN